MWDCVSNRRYNNVVMDEERKMQADIFLGLKQRLYFPTLHLPYRYVCRGLIERFHEVSKVWLGGCSIMAVLPYTAPTGMVTGA